MDYVPYRNFNLPTLPDQSRKESVPILDEMNRVLAAIHDVDIVAAGLSDYAPRAIFIAANSTAGLNSTGQRGVTKES